MVVKKQSLISRLFKTVHAAGVLNTVVSQGAEYRTKLGLK